MTDINIIDLLGWIGGIEVLIAYWLISTKRVNETSLPYHLLNLTGAVFLIINTIAVKAYPSAFVNVVWVGVAGYSIWKYSLALKAKSLKRKAESEELRAES